MMNDESNDELEIYIIIKMIQKSTIFNCILLCKIKNFRKNFVGLFDKNIACDKSLLGYL